MPLDWTSAYADLHAQGEATFPPACLRYVLDGVLAEARAGARDGGDGHVTPARIVARFRARAQRDFGALLPEVLEGWNLTTPAELGEAVRLLARQGLLTLSPEDTPEAFAEDARPLAARETEAGEAGNA